MISGDEIGRKLDKYVISAKMDSEPYARRIVTLDGEILLENQRDPGNRVKGVLAVSFEDFLAQPITEAGKANRKKAGKPVAATNADLERFDYGTLMEADPLNNMGYHKYFKKWHAEGLI